MVFWLLGEDTWLLTTRYPLSEMSIAVSHLMTTFALVSCSQLTSPQLDPGPGIENEGLLACALACYQEIQPFPHSGIDRPLISHTFASW